MVASMGTGGTNRAIAFGRIVAIGFWMAFGRISMVAAARSGNKAIVSGFLPRRSHTSTVEPMTRVRAYLTVDASLTKTII